MASVPDLITVLDSQSGSHLGTPECKCLSLTNEKNISYECVNFEQIRTDFVLQSSHLLDILYGARK